MAKMRKSKLNVLTTLMKQGVATLSGIILHRVLIGAFGSVVYGATTSIAQFLSYISLLEGGIGGVARGALYGPLANGDVKQVSRIHRAIYRFFLKIAGIFLIYTLVIAYFYHDIANLTLWGRGFTFGLVVAISLSIMSNYVGGFADLTLMNADQKQYLTNTVITITNFLNLGLVILLIKLGANIMVVKLASALIFVTRRVFYTVYVGRHYHLPKVEMNGYELEQKWTGMGQHIAYFLHSNTDVILLTLFADLKMVAVYSVYYLVIRSIWDLSSAFSGGMEAAFGELIAKKQTDALNRSYGKYSIMLTLVALVLFGCAGVLIIPFVRLYMAGVTDANYIQPLFALLLLVSEAMNCLVLPYTTLPVSANRLKATRWGSYGEAILNIGLSLILIHWEPLIGVAIGTLVATTFKSLFYMIYTARHILVCRVWKVLGRFAGSVAVVLGISCGGMTLLWNVSMENFFVWAMWAVVVFAVVVVIAMVYSLMAWPREVKALFGSVLKHKH